MTARSGASQGVLAAAALIGVVTLVARIVGFGRWVAFSYSVGAGCVGEAYSTANILPNVLFEIAAGGALAAVVVPLVARALGRGRREDADATASALLTWAVAVLLPLSLLLALVAQPLTQLLYGAGGCDGGAALAATMLVLFAPQVVLYGIGIVLAGVLQAHRRFLAAALAPLLSSVVVILTYLLYGSLPSSAEGTANATATPATAVLAVGTTLGVVALSLPLFVPVRRAGVRLRPTWRLPDRLGAAARRLALAGVIALVAQQLAVVVSFAVMHAHASAGTVNVYQYVQAVYLLPYAVLAVPIATAAFPALASSQAAGELQQEGEAADEVMAASAARPTAADPRAVATLAESVRSVVIAGCLGVAVLWAAARPVGAFFGALDAGRTDAVSEQALSALGAGLAAFAPGLLGFALAALLTRALYVRGQPVLAAVVLAAGWAVAGLAPVVLLRGQEGAQPTLVTLGAASSVGMTVAAAGLCLAVRRWWGATALAGSARTAVVGVLGAVAGGLLGAWAGDLVLPTETAGVLVALLAAALAALVAGVAVALLLARFDGANLRVVTSRLGGFLGRSRRGSAGTTVGPS